jgi:hypothetical protein
MKMMFETTHKLLNERIHKYTVTHNGEPIPYVDALNLWQHDEAFFACFVSLLFDSPFSAYRWETPPITNATANRQFEFVLVDSPGLTRTPDVKTYATYFTNDDINEGIVAFESLGKDAMLIAPSPRGPDSTYCHLAEFIRNAPDSQKQALWRIVGQTAQQTLTDRPLWVSTAGGGVAWLHVRLDSRPKYYRYAPYKSPHNHHI